MSKRINWIDYAKGLAIFLVIAGHSVRLHSVTWNFIFSFHMPVFFLISGYLFKVREPMDIFKRKFPRIIKPYISTCVLLIIGSLSIMIYHHVLIADIVKNSIKLVIASLYGSGVPSPKPFIYIPMIGAIWFLLSLFIAELIFSILVKLTVNRNPIYLFLSTSMISFLGFIIGKFILLPLSLDSALLATFYLYVGYVVKKHNLFPRTFNLPVKIIMLLLWFFTVYLGGVSLVNVDFPLFPISLIGSICGSYFFMIFCKYLSDHNILNMQMIYIGKESLIILCFHLIEMYFIPWQRILSVIHVQNTSGTIITGLIILFRIIFASLIAVYAKKVILFRRMYY